MIDGSEIRRSPVEGSGTVSLSTIIYKVWTTSQVVGLGVSEASTNRKMVMSDRAEGIRSLWKVSFFGGVPRTKDSDYAQKYSCLWIHVDFFLQNLRKYKRYELYAQILCSHSLYI